MLVALQQGSCVLEPARSRHFGGGLRLAVAVQRVRPGEDQPLQRLHQPQRRCLVHRGLPERIAAVGVRPLLEEDPHHRGVAVAAGPVERRGAALVRCVRAGLVLEQVEYQLRGPAGAAVVESGAAPRVFDVEMAAGVGVQLEEEGVPVEGGLEEARRAPRVVPRRYAEELVPPVLALRAADPHPLAQHRGQVLRHEPLRDAGLPVVVEELAVGRRLHGPAAPRVAVARRAPARQQREVGGGAHSHLQRRGLRRLGVRRAAVADTCD
mmetsp:Transcript_66604/g.187585  ORF Transcript_66604/g.187585 Transcript_66604/m.187585 type:complete len:266 (+) Transcript_66604:541-1338(+)